MGTIVVIGGGEIKDLETLPIDERIVKLTGKKHPKAVFIPTASSDAEGYAETFKEIYGKRLGCKVDVLYLLENPPTADEIEQRILGADLIYVGGGNTKMMMKRWRELGVDKVMKRAYKAGVIMSGLSAGGICYFEAGHSDSLSFEQEEWEYIRVEGLGLLEGLHCPHFDSATEGKPRTESFSQFMQESKEMGVAVDEHCAIIFGDGTYRVIQARKDKHAYRLFVKDKKVVTEQLPDNTQRPLEELYDKNTEL